MKKRTSTLVFLFCCLFTVLMLAGCAQNGGPSSTNTDKPDAGNTSTGTGTGTDITSMGATGSDAKRYEGFDLYYSMAMGFSIYLPKDVTMVLNEWERVQYQSCDADFRIRKVVFAKIAEHNPETMTTEDYAKAAIQANNFNTVVEKKDGLTSFIFREGDNSVYTVILKEAGAFWTVQAMCKTEKLDEMMPIFITSAKSCSFD